jgi:SprT protein
MITQLYLDRVNLKIQETIQKYFGIDFKYDIPVTFRTDMKAKAGIAYRRNHRIELSEQLFLENIEKFFATTIPHEVAHIIQYLAFPNAKQGHGPEWRSIMDRIGVESNRCHTYDVTSLVTQNRHKYACVCAGRIFELSTRMHNLIQSEKHRRCNTCNTRIVKI